MNSIEKTSLYNYVAQHNPDAANKLIGKYGIPPQKSILDLSYVLRAIVNKKGDFFLKEIAGIHPDKYLITEYITGPADPNARESFANCSGGCSKCGKSSANGDNDEWLYDNVPPTQKTPATTDNTLAMVVLFSVLALVFLKNN